MISQNGDWTEACYQSSLAGGSGWQLNLGELMPNNFHIFSMQRRIPIKKIQLHFLIIQIYLFIYSESFLNIRHFWKQVVYTYKIYVYKETDTMNIVTLSWISMTLKRKCPQRNFFQWSISWHLSDTHSLLHENSFWTDYQIPGIPRHILENAVWISASKKVNPKVCNLPLSHLRQRPWGQCPFSIVS